MPDAHFDFALTIPEAQLLANLTLMGTYNDRLTPLEVEQIKHLDRELREFIVRHAA